MDHVTHDSRSLTPSVQDPRIVLVHGFLGSPASWDAMRARLSPRARTETLSLLGHASSIEHGEPDVATFDDEITRLLGRRRIRGGETLVGYSLGARVALGLAARSQRPVSRLILVSGRDGLEDADEARARREVDDALAETLTTRGLAAFVDRWEALPLFASQARLNTEERNAHRARRLAHDPSGVARALRVLSLGRMPRYGRDAISRTRRVDLVVGELDAKFRALAERFVKEHGHAGDVRIHVVSGAGHDVVLERPDALAEILEERS